MMPPWLNSLNRLKWMAFSRGLIATYVYGDNTTVTMSLSDMIYHTKAVKNGAPKTLIISDMPFMTYNISVEETLRHATQLIQAGAHAVMKFDPYMYRPLSAIQEGI